MKTSANHHHGPACGHIAVEHHGHTDYLKGGHLEHQEGEQLAQHVVEIDSESLKLFLRLESAFGRVADALLHLAY